MKMTVEMDIPDQRIKDLLTGHPLYDWFRSIVLNGDGTYTIEYDNPNEDEGTFKGKKIVGPLGIKRGLVKMANGTPWQWSNFMDENDDMDTCDVAWQYIVFGELIYG